MTSSAGYPAWQRQGERLTIVQILLLVAASLLPQKPFERIKVANLTKHGARRDDPKPDPKPINNTTEHRDDLMPEERRERDDEEDGDGNQPACGDGTDLFADWCEPVHDLFVVDCHERYDDDDDGEDDVPVCESTFRQPCTIC